MASHNDQPVLDCKLGRAIWREKIAKQIIGSAPPKTIAIHGTWGTGKTSVMTQLHKMLGGESIYSNRTGQLKSIDDVEKNVKTVWFEAWQYQHEDNIVIALLKEIREQLSLSGKIYRGLKKSSYVTLMTALQSIDLTIEQFGVKFGLGKFVTTLRKEAKDYNKAHFQEKLSSDVLKSMLKKSIDLLLNLDNFNSLKQILSGSNKSERKLVILIDDLDRCEPSVAFKILESIKVYLNLENCIFVIGMDMEAIQRIIAQHYENKLAIDNETTNNERELLKLSRLYLEKICQDTYHIPVITKDQKLTYFLQLLEIINDNIKRNINIIIGEFNLLPPFPRSIKIFANIVLFFLEKHEINNYLIEDGTDSIRTKQFIILSYLYAFHHEIYQLIYMYPGFYNDAFIKYCRDGDYGHDLLKSIQLPKTQTSDQIGGTAASEVSKNILAYPHTYLRQVLWIRDMVIEVGQIEDVEINNFKI